MSTDNASASSDSTQRPPWHRRLRRIGLGAGPLLALVGYLVLPTEYRNVAGELVDFTAGGRAVLAVMIWMAVWWMTEAVDIAATALLPVALFPILGIADIQMATAPYANDLVFLFLGGFIMALAMQRWGLDRRIALATLRLVGTRPTNMVGGFMLATAALSGFVSNTATTAMMLPIGLSVIALMRRQQLPHRITERSAAVGGQDNFALCILLGIAYAASIGGIATVIGTPPNLFLVGFINDGIAAPYRQPISFLRWMAIGVPLALLLLPLAWLLLTRIVYPLERQPIAGGRTLIEEQYRRLGPPAKGERTVSIVFSITVLAWVTRPVLQPLSFEWGAERILPFAGMSDSGVAILAALALFAIPVDRSKGVFAMDWDTASRLPWGTLILFGGGLSLAAAVQTNGVAEFIGAQTFLLGGWPTWGLVLVIVALVIFLTELTSNTATVATLIPILAALAPSLDLHPYQLIVPATIAASCAFMMPVATPPNAIVFGAGYLTIPQMCKAGLWLNLIGIVVISVLLYAVVPPLLID